MTVMSKLSTLNHYIMFHDIRSVDSSFFPRRYLLPYFYTPEEFEKFLKRYPPSSVSGFANGTKYIYTFDDGLKDHLQVAERFYKLGKTCIFFVPTEIFSKSDFVIDTHLIQFIIASGNEKDIEAELLRILVTRDIDLKQLQCYKHSLWPDNIWSNEMIFITRVLREFGDDDLRKTMIKQLYNHFVPISRVKLHQSLYLTSQDLIFIKSLGHTIGGHGRKSIDLSKASIREVEDEIGATRQMLASLGESHFYFAYPNGGYTNQVLATLTSNGFSLGFTTKHSYNTSDFNRLLQPRLHPFKL